MKNGKRRLFLLALLAGVWLTMPAVLAAEPISIEKVTPSITDGGAAAAQVQFTVQSDTPVIVIGAVYREDMVMDVVTQTLTLTAESNTVNLENLQTHANATELRVLAWQPESLAPLCPSASVKLGAPVLEGFAVKLGSTQTYEGLIDQKNKTVHLNIPLYVSNNGSVSEIGDSSPYSGTVSEAEYQTLIAAVPPQISCSPGAKAVETGAMDLSSPRTLTLQDGFGRTTAYTVVADAFVVQRNFNFKASNLYLVNPSTNYGDNLIRHNAPGPVGTRIGSGVWFQEGFAYKQDSNGNYIDQDGNILGYFEDGTYVKVGSGDFVRDDTSPGKLQIVPDTGVRMVKDRTGNYSLYSAESNSPGGNVELTDSMVSFAVEELTDGAFDVLFGKGRFLLRALPNGNGGSCNLYFGLEKNLKDTGIDLAFGETCRVRCMVEKLDSSTTRGILCINDRYVTAIDDTPTESYSLNSYHVKFRPAEQALCKVMLHEWELRYQVSPTPQKILDIYNDVIQETKAIYLWMATLYDGAADKESGNGFFYAPSSKANSALFAAEIESTGQMISNMSSILKYMPTDMKERFINFFESRYDAASGYYYDPVYKERVNSRQTSRNYSNATNALRRLKAYAATEPVTLTSTIPASADTALMLAAEVTEEEETSGADLYLPEEYESPATFRAWIEALPWDTHSWTAGDKLGNCALYINRLPQEEQAAYWHEMLDYLVTNQNEDGTWGKSSNPSFGVEISGIFKVLANLKSNIPAEVMDTDPSWTAAGLSAENYVPRAQKIYDYIMEYFLDPDYYYSNTLMIRNTLDVITYITPFIDGNRLENDLPEILEYCYTRMKEFKIPGTAGEYCSSVDKNGVPYSSASTGMGYNQGMGMEEGCINTATSITKIRSIITKYYQVEAFAFDKEFATEFYQILQNELDTQYWKNVYTQKYHVNTDDTTLDETFESYETGSEPLPVLPNPQTFTHSASYSTATVVSGAQKDGSTGKLLEFAFDNPNDNGSSTVTFKNPYLPVLTRGKKATLTFDMKVDADVGLTSPNVLYFGFPNAVLFSLRLQSDGTYRIQTRTRSSKIGAVTVSNPVKKNIWYTFQVVYDPFADTKVQLYLDGTLVYSGNHYYGNPANDGSISDPPLTISGFSMTYYMRAEGTLWLDNLQCEVA